MVTYRWLFGFNPKGPSRHVFDVDISSKPEVCFITSWTTMISQWVTTKADLSQERQKASNELTYRFEIRCVTHILLLQLPWKQIASERFLPKSKG